MLHVLFFLHKGNGICVIDSLSINSERGPEITLFASLISFGSTPSDSMVVVRLNFEMVFSMSELLASLKKILKK